MALFAVIWSYTTDASVKEAAHAEHLIFVKDAAARGILQEAGAWADGAGAYWYSKRPAKTLCVPCLRRILTSSRVSS